MKQEILRMFARIMLPLGLVIILLSLWMLPMQEKGSAVHTITLIDIGLGTILTVLGMVLILRERRINKDS